MIRLVFCANREDCLQVGIHYDLSIALYNETDTITLSSHELEKVYSEYLREKIRLQK